MISGFPERLRTLRTQNNLSQKEVANQLGLSPAIISSYETGERTPSLDKLLALSSLYKCSTDYLLGKKTNVSPKMLDVSTLTDSQYHALQTFLILLENGE